MKILVSAWLAMVSTSVSTVPDYILLFPESGLLYQVPIEIVLPPKEQKDARNKAYELKQNLLARGFRLSQDGDWKGGYFAKCMVWPKQPQVGEATLRVECQSFAMWEGDDPYFTQDAPSTPKESLAFIDAFSVQHRKRLARSAPVPKQAPSLRYQIPRSTRPPLTT